MFPTSKILEQIQDSWRQIIPKGWKENKKELKKKKEARLLHSFFFFFSSFSQSFEWVPLLVLQHQWAINAFSGAWPASCKASLQFTNNYICSEEFWGQKLIPREWNFSVWEEISVRTFHIPLFFFRERNFLLTKYKLNTSGWAYLLQLCSLGY